MLIRPIKHHIIQALASVCLYCNHCVLIITHNEVNSTPLPLSRLLCVETALNMWLLWPDDNTAVLHTMLLVHALGALQTAHCESHEY